MVTRFSQKVPRFLFPIPFLLLLIFFSTARLQAADGAKLFKANCTTCHTMTDQKLTGPGLKDVFSRIPKDPEWLKKWITNSSAMIKSGDPYAVKIFNENTKSAMTVFDGILSAEDIDAIIGYLKNPPAEGPTGTTGGGGDPYAVAPEPEAPGNYYLWFILLCLIILVAALRSAKRNLQNALNSKKNLPPVPEYTLKEWMNNRKRTVALILIVLVCMGSKWSWDAMMDIGVFTGYKPEQPIKFSHAVHAGQNGINCEYCHSGVSKSKVAGVPSANVCMNCHKAVSSGTRTGETEIAKIYAAVGWNPKTQKYENPPKPLEWVKVHNLPDFVFFSHKQHVVVGKQECKTCHGELEKMDVAKQVQPLTMGWCVNCHRETAVPGMADNPYYEDLHKKLAERYKGEPITVAKMGGIECAKCHY